MLASLILGGTVATVAAVTVTVPSVGTLIPIPSVIVFGSDKLPQNTSVPNPPTTTVNGTATNPAGSVDLTKPVDQALYKTPQANPTAPAAAEESSPTGTIKNPPKQRSTTEPKVKAEPKIKPDPKLIPKPSAIKEKSPRD